MMAFRAMISLEKLPSRTQEKGHLLFPTHFALKGINGGLQPDKRPQLLLCLLLEEARGASYFVVSHRLLLPEKSLFMEGEDVAEKTLVHKPAVKRVSTH